MNPGHLTIKTRSAQRFTKILSWASVLPCSRTFEFFVPLWISELRAICLLGLAISCGPAVCQAPAEPPAPAASPPVQKLLDESWRLLKEKKAAESLSASYQALAAAKPASDAPGEARSHQVRAVSLEALNRIAEAAEAWKEEIGRASCRERV